MMHLQRALIIEMKFSSNANNIDNHANCKQLNYALKRERRQTTMRRSRTRKRNNAKNAVGIAMVFGKIGHSLSVKIKR